MLSDMQVTRVKLLFKRYDVNNDGFIERSDVEAAAKEHARMLGAAPDSSNFKEVVLLELTIWEKGLAQADKNRDGKVSSEEFQRAFDAWTNDWPSFERVLRASCDCLFDMVDRNGDKKINLEEYEMLSVLKDTNGITEAFRLMDPNNTGYLTKDTLLKRWLEFWRPS